MITFLQAINRVLVKLREPELSTLSGIGIYQKLIAALVNEAKEEVEAAWDWNYQRISYTVTTVAGTSTYAITGAGSEMTIEGVFNGTNNDVIFGPLNNIYADWDRTATTLGSTNGTSLYCDIVGIDASGDIQIRLTPTPDAVQTVTIYGRSKQAYLDYSSDAGTYIKAPWRPIVFLAYAKAVSERGEDGGNMYDETMEDYRKALADSVSRDEKLNFRNTTWYAT